MRGNGKESLIAHRREQGQAVGISLGAIKGQRRFALFKLAKLLQPAVLACRGQLVAMLDDQYAIGGQQRARSEAIEDGGIEA